MQRSAVLEELQSAREELDADRSRRAAESRQRQLRERRMIGRTAAGRRVFARYAERVALELERIIAVYSVKKAAGVHHAAIPLLQVFDALERPAAVVVRTALNTLTGPVKYQTFCIAIGTALETEYRACRLARARRSQMPRLLAKAGSVGRLVSEESMEALGVPLARWDSFTRFQLGAFAFDALARVGLVDVEVVASLNGRRTRWATATRAAIRATEEIGPLLIEVSRSAMVVPPRPWEGHHGGGHRDNPHSLIRAPRFPHREALALEDQLPPELLLGVNWLQAQALRLDPAVVEVQRESWQQSILGLWPHSRVPPEVPPQPPQSASQAEWRSWKVQAALAHQNRRLYRSSRLGIERRLVEAEGMAVLQQAHHTNWFQAHQLDFRGRIYAVNRTLSHQGPDASKAVLSFADARPLDEEGFDWLLKAAAGHHSKGRASWEERLQWGRDEIRRHLAVADDPLSCLGLWRDASDPWQYLQAARAIRDWLEDRSSPIGVPIRFDQTTSGCGILSALLRDEEIGRLTNLTGDSRADLYGTVAGLLHALVRMDLEHEAPWIRMSAEMWLERGIDRGLCKGAVMARPYGGTLQGLEQQLVALRDEELGGVGSRAFHVRVGLPARYLAGKLWWVLSRVTARLMRCSVWIRKMARALIGLELEPVVTTPSGLRIHLGERAVQGRSFTSWIGGSQTTTLLMGPTKQWSPELTCKSITANWIHSFDGAFCAQVAAACAEQGLPLLTNHDCFAAPAWAAGRLHSLLLREAHGFWQPDWLAVQHQELERLAGESLPAPPERGGLDTALIGQNPYLFS